MTAIAVSAIVVTASVIVLAAIAASGLGPVRSLRKSVGRFADVSDEADTLRRNLEIFERRASELRGRDGSDAQRT